MGLLGKIFGSQQQSAEDIYRKNAIEILQLIQSPTTDAKILKAIVFITFIQIAIFNSLNLAEARGIIDLLVNKAKDASKAYMVRISDLASTDEELEAIINDFPSGLKIDSKTNINGLAAFEALYFTNVQSIVPDFIRRADDGLYLAIMLSRKIRGNDDFKDIMTLNQVALKLMKMSEELLRSIK